MLAERLADYAARLTFRRLPEAVIHEVKRRLLDSVACAFGAWSAQPSRIARALASSVPLRHGATIWGTRTRTTPDLAAFANGTLVRYLDYNDTYLSKEPAHPSDNIPACLAVAEFLRASGPRFIEAVVLAYEIQCRLCDAAALRPRGWDHVTYGAFSTVLSTAKLLRLSRAKTIHAVNLAGITAAALRQTRVGEVSLWKACAFANAARNGIFAALIARQGMSGPAAMFEGEKGFMQIVSGPFDLPAFGGEPGIPFRILDTFIKAYPVEYHAQSAVEAALDIRRQVLAARGRFDSTAVQSIVVGSFDVAIEIIGRDPEKWHPQTRETADHSLPFCVATALAYGTVTPRSFSPTRLKDRSLRDLIQKVRVVEVPDFSDRYPRSMPTRLQVTLADGGVFETQVDVALGHSMRPMSDQDVEAKLYALTEGRLKDSEVARILRTVWKVDQLDDVSKLVAAMPVVNERSAQ
ncbi:MAG: MmgE/PrpD family protein [Nitrospirae bacterium]|nr:MAG: MmgE/PrpD family protein [Nitrospirota bacterium]